MSCWHNSGGWLPALVDGNRTNDDSGWTSEVHSASECGDVRAQDSARGTKVRSFSLSGRSMIE
jgi:hypothetical protein